MNSRNMIDENDDAHCDHCGKKRVRGLCSFCRQLLDREMQAAKMRNDDGDLGDPDVPAGFKRPSFAALDLSVDIDPALDELLNRAESAAGLDDDAPPVIAVSVDCLQVLVCKAEAHDAIRASRDILHEEAAANADMVDVYKRKVEMLRGRLSRAIEDKSKAEDALAAITAKLKAIVGEVT